jgi:iron complex transport system substrate-binding protein
MVRLAGGRDDLGREGQPSTTITWKEIAEYEPETVVLMPCGFDVPQTLAHLEAVKSVPQWRNLPAVRSGQVYAVHGSFYFSRPGPRLVDGLEILAEIIHPELFPRRRPETDWTRVETPVGH